MGDEIKNRLKRWLFRKPWFWGIAGGAIAFFSLIMLITMGGAGDAASSSGSSSTVNGYRRYIRYELNIR